MVHHQVPKIMHQIWYQGAHAIPTKYLENINNLRAANPSWEHKIWDKHSLRKECASLGPKYLQTFDTYYIMHQQIDFGRYCVLLKYGGISVDMDVLALKSFDTLIFLPLVTNLVISELPLMGHEATIYSSLLNNATLICPPNDKALHAIIHTLIRRQRFQVRKWWWKSSLVPNAFVVMKTTGPDAITDILQNLPPHIPFDVLPPTYFEPCLGQDPYCQPASTSILYHQHHSSWHPFSPIITAYMIIRPFAVVIIVLCVLSCLMHYSSNNNNLRPSKKL